MKFTLQNEKGVMMKKIFRNIIPLAGYVAAFLCAPLLTAQDHGLQKPVTGVGGHANSGGPPAGVSSGSAAQIVKMRETLAEEERADLEALRVKMIADGVEYLRKVQLPSGSFSASPRVGIGPTIIDAIGMLRVGVSLDDPLLAKTLKFIEESIREDGGIYSEGGRLANYESCVGLMCFSLANKAAGDGRYDDVIEAAERFVRATQYGEANGTKIDDENFGGVGYDKDQSTRPDLSNTQFFIEALRETGAMRRSGNSGRARLCKSVPEPGIGGQSGLAPRERRRGIHLHLCLSRRESGGSGGQRRTAKLRKHDVRGP